MLDRFPNSPDVKQSWTRVQQVETALIEEENVMLTGGNIKEEANKKKALGPNDFGSLTNFRELCGFRLDSKWHKKYLTESGLWHGSERLKVIHKLGVK